MITPANNENGKSNGAHGSNQVNGSNGHSASRKTSRPARKRSSSESTVDDLIQQVRANNKTVLDQSQRIEELESFLACVVHLSAKVKELELELQSAL